MTSTILCELCEKIIALKSHLLYDYAKSSFGAQIWGMITKCDVGDFAKTFVNFVNIVKNIVFQISNYKKNFRFIHLVPPKLWCRAAGNTGLSCCMTGRSSICTPPSYPTSVPSTCCTSRWTHRNVGSCLGPGLTRVWKSTFIRKLQQVTLNLF